MSRMLRIGVDEGIWSPQGARMDRFLILMIVQTNQHWFTLTQKWVYELRMSLVYCLNTELAA